MGKPLIGLFIFAVLAACQPNLAALIPTGAARQKLEQDQYNAANLRILDSYRAPDGKYLVVYTNEVKAGEQPDQVNFGGITLALRPPFQWQAVNQQDFIADDPLPNELVVTGSYTEPGRYSVLYGQLLTDTAITIEAVLDDGSILRDEDGGESFAFFPTDGRYVHELRLLNAQGDLVQVNDPGALEQAAAEALSEYFDSLFTGNYNRAAELYGGSYEVLADMNPEVNPDDTAAARTLLEQACTVNGFVCLRLASYGVSAHPFPGAFTFQVQFEDENGQVYTRLPCCETPMPGEVVRSEFGYTVVKDPEGRFRVMELPIMEP